MLMKHFRFTIVIISGLVVGLGLLAVGRLAWGGSDDNIRKWSWNAIVSSDTVRYPNPIGLGWLSMNCRNDFDNDGVIDDRCKNSSNDPIDYGLKVNLDTIDNTALGSFDGTNDYVQGCAWSATFGWVCFDRDPSYCPVNKLACRVLSDDGVKIVKDATYPFYYLKSSIPQTATSSVINSDPETRASILNIVATTTKSQGYIGFPFDSGSGQTPAQLGLTGNVTSCFGCSTSNNNGSDQCDVCYMINDGLNDPTISPNPNIMCTQCSSCNAATRGGSCGTTSNTCPVASCQKCYTQPGVVVNYYPVCQNDGSFCTSNSNCTGGASCNYTKASAELCGWGYNSAAEGSAKASGLGWVAFNPVVYGKATPYVSVKNGDVLSRGDISAPLAPPIYRSNATYLIDAKGTITRWTSSSTPDYALPLVRDHLGNVPSFLGYDTVTGLATSTLGNLDLKGLITDTGSNFNKYGSLIDESTRLESELEAGIAGRVLYFPNNVTVSTSVIVAAGDNGESGSGIVYVNGNLTINKDITYAGTAVNRLKYVPSLVWIVRGDVIIDPTVKNLAGTFIVIGDGDPHACPAIVSANNPPASQGCGRFSTGNDSSILAGPQSLTVSGHVLARQFVFQRSYSAVDSKNKTLPSETFIADGRLQANPPAGLTDLSRTLPKFNFSF